MAEIERIIKIDHLTIEVINTSADMVELKITTSGGFNDTKILSSGDILQLKLTDNLFLAGVNLNRNNPELWE